MLLAVSVLGVSPCLADSPPEVAPTIAELPGLPLPHFQFEPETKLFALNDTEPTDDSEAWRPRWSKGTVFRYKRPVEIGGKDYVLKWKAPGKKKSIMTFELKFY